MSAIPRLLRGCKANTSQPSPAAGITLQVLCFFDHKLFFVLFVLLQEPLISLQLSPTVGNCTRGAAGNTAASGTGTKTDRTRPRLLKVQAALGFFTVCWSRLSTHAV
jgi:hypothetical protein